jgi:hypothetical protein
VNTSLCHIMGHDVSREQKMQWWHYNNIIQSLLQ